MTALRREGLWTTISVLRDTDVPVLAEAVLEGDLPWHWRGVPPSYEGLRQTLWDGVLAQWAIRRRSSDRLVGHVLFYGYNGAGRHCFVQAWVDESVRRSGWPLEGVALAIDTVFAKFDVRKVMFEAPETSMKQYAKLITLVGVHHGGADSCSSAHAMNTSSSPQWRHPLTGVRTPPGPSLTSKAEPVNS